MIGVSINHREPRQARLDRSLDLLRVILLLEIQEDDIDTRRHDLSHTGATELNDLREHLCFYSFELS